jgi:hypothetical protein
VVLKTKTWHGQAHEIIKHRTSICLYDLFPEFVRYFNSGNFVYLYTGFAVFWLNSNRWGVESIPIDWEIESEARSAFVELLVNRADYLAQTTSARLQQQDGTWASL